MEDTLPIHEYRCEECGRVVSVLLLSGAEDPECPRCGSAGLTRCRSRFAHAQSADERYGSFDDAASVSDLEDDDPMSVARWMRRMGSELGPELDDFEDPLDPALDDQFAGSGYEDDDLL